jgi:hypothetical protein
MFFSSWLRKPSAKSRTTRQATSTFRPRLEVLECRCLPSTYYAATAADLIADINAANKAGGANTIVLTASSSSPYDLTAVNNIADGATGLPVIKGGALTIVGNGDKIERDSGAPSFRLLDVARGGSLTLQNLTLVGGRLWGSGASAEGGGIYNQGTLVLSGVTIGGNTVSGFVGQTNHSKPGGAGSDAAGGGIWSNGSLTMENGSVIAGNWATGGDGGYSYGTRQWGPGGNAFGGGICIAGGTANITNSSIGTYDSFSGRGFGNTAQGGAGANLSSNGARTASGYGSGIYVAGGTLTMNADRVESNTAQGGKAAPAGTGSANFYFSGFGYGGGLCLAGGTATLTNDTVDHNLAGDDQSPHGYGGGIFIAPGATVYLDSFTVANTNFNTTYTPWGPDIYGTYIFLP